MKKLEGKVAYITGGAMGNGFGIAKVLAKHGATVILADYSETVYKAEESLKSMGYNAKGFLVDITNNEKVVETVEETIKEFGKIDILINNAGICRLESFENTTDELRDLHFDINIKGPWNVTRAIVKHMCERNYGKIVNLSSVTGYMVADPGEVAYATTKAALIGFTKSLAREYADKNINVNAICPGYIRTPMVDKMAVQTNKENPESVIDGIASGVPLGRLGKIEEVGELAAFLASDEASYLTGIDVVIDGGSTLPETVSMGV